MTDLEMLKRNIDNAHVDFAARNVRDVAANLYDNHYDDYIIRYMADDLSESELIKWVVLTKATKEEVLLYLSSVLGASVRSFDELKYEKKYIVGGCRMFVSIEPIRTIRMRN